MGHFMYRGRLAVERDLVDLAVDLLIDDGILELRTSRESLGTWPLAEVSASRIEDGRFVLQLGDEEAYFRAEDPLGFSFEAVTAIQAVRRSRGFLGSKAKNGGPRRADPQSATPTENSIPVTSPARNGPVLGGRHLKSAGQGA
ncbi:MAG: hypothetical protein ACRDWH_09745 [Acidimicrobiia bacterium]